MRVRVFVMMLFLSLVNCQSQTTSAGEPQSIASDAPKASEKNIRVEVHSRVDTTQKEVRDIVSLWIDYLNAGPDKLSDSPYWNAAEKKQYSDFDHSRTLLYQFPAEELLNYFRPKILSVEKEGAYYAIRTIFMAADTSRGSDISNPWAIQKLYAEREGNEWKLKNALTILTEKWNRITIGKITFIYSPAHEFNKDLAMKANEFCDQVTTDLQLGDWAPFDFYITTSADELGKLLNFEFFFAGYTTGIAINNKRLLLSGTGSEYYPHEFVHMLVPSLERHSLIEEGLATWKGGQGSKTFEESAKALATELSKNSSVSFNDVLTKQWGWQCAAFYTTGAVFCKVAYEQGGSVKLSKLLQIKEDDEQLIDQLCQLFKLEKHQLNDFWRKEILKYLNQ